MVDGIDDRFQRGAFFTQRLSAFRLVPNVRLFQLGVYFFEAFFLGIVVKDTPSEPLSVQTGPEFGFLPD
ncbi:hypothetical protein AU490_12170 [Lonsdalea populi]|uniref:Uncharacterized protein n=2 Tax=Lonsdalea TaxID=1082702 RepID=A0ACD1J8T6_9GAMM|nr:hypothetical protein AU508_13140 [Lonsdalea populi]RAT11240.1 hypothetical protein AU485_14845 [Lonsdalea quercina]OSM98606.1 hypothetical protein AU499_12600 [Lonsdalea populi]RAT16795.1 hypothetical protein AU486_06930 [Lonsdalea quercina]RAT20355.1 hypothetical protein AU487_08415 [Lonsdalea populi]